MSALGAGSAGKPLRGKVYHVRAGKRGYSCHETTVGPRAKRRKILACRLDRTESSLRARAAKRRKGRK